MSLKGPQKGERGMNLVQNDYFYIWANQQNELFIRVEKKGFPIKEMNEIIKQHPRIHITHFLPLKKALEEGLTNDIHIGQLKNEVELFVSKDEMEASVIIYCSDDDFEEERSRFVDKVYQTLEEEQINHGILHDVIKDQLKPNEWIIIAKGTPPQKGEDAKIRLIEVPDRKPSIKEDGRADFFDLNFFKEVKKGDWLGEKTPPTEGRPGMTIRGQVVPAPAGRDVPLRYDVNSIFEYKENEISVIKAKIDGIVEYRDGKITVGSHLYIKGDVGVETGNIEFNGSITIQGTIQPGYCVVAEKDISILSPIGVSNCGKISSLRGDVFIKGGIFGNEATTVEAGTNIFVKHAHECKLVAANSIYIGSSAIGCQLQAERIHVDERRGQIIGGKAEAKYMVTSGTIGNKSEIKTEIIVHGFDKSKLKIDYKHILMMYKEVIEKVEQKRKMIETRSSSLPQMTDQQRKLFEVQKDELEKMIAKLYELNNQRKKFEELLKIKGEGQVVIGRQAFPQTVLKLKSTYKQLNSVVKGTYYVAEGKLLLE